MGVLHQTALRTGAISAASLSTKAVKRSQRAAGGDSEDRALAVRRAGAGGSVEVPIGGLHQRCSRIGAVGAAG